LAALFSCSKKSTDGDGDGIKPPGPTYPIICDAPAWSPDGKTIAYHHNGTIKVYESGRYTVDLNLRGVWFISPDGTNKRLFLWGGYSPDWSPDGQELALKAYSQIFAIKTNGDSLTQLTFKGRNFFPDWSPDGKRIAYDRTTHYPDTPAESSGIWIMDADGTNKRRIGAGRFPDWSPDMLHFVYGPGEIWIADTNGANPKQLTFLGGDSRDPHWSPDGSKIVFGSQKMAPGFHLPQIWVMNSHGSNLRQLSTEGGISPAWSPDGNKIVYVRYNWTEYSSKHGQLWIMDADGSNKRQLTFDGW
jgi:TolB protein